MDDIQRFDEFEWLLANKVVNENVLPDENVLVYSGHSAFSIGLTELYFVELFYDKYVRVFGSAFIQNKIDALKNETARKWANYAMDRIPAVIKPQFRNPTKSLRPLMPKPPRMRFF